MPLEWKRKFANCRHGKRSSGPEEERKRSKAERHGKMTARERPDYFFDPGTFMEFDLFAKHIGMDYGLDKAELPADGVITGFGKVDGRDVFAYSEEFTVVAGTYGERHGRKICKTIDLARKMGAPIVGMNDSGGARVTEEMGALSEYVAFNVGRCLSELLSLRWDRVDFEERCIYFESTKFRSRQGTVYGRDGGMPSKAAGDARPDVPGLSLCVLLVRLPGR